LRQLSLLNFRRHFLKFWMPRAEPPARIKPISEPVWWSDFLDECYPDAYPRDFATILKREYFGELFQEGQEWARTRGERAT
jgi:hypothetical protein